MTAKGDPLEMIARVVPFESFRAEIEAAVLTPVSEKKSTADVSDAGAAVALQSVGRTGLVDSHRLSGSVTRLAFPPETLNFI